MKKKPAPSLSTFSELVRLPHPPIDKVKRVLREHARAGAPIDADLVLRTIAPWKVTIKKDADHMIESARLGIRRCLSQNSRMAEEYRKLLGELA